LRGRGLPMLGALVLALGLGAVVASADTVSADGDTVKPNNNLGYTPAANFTERCSSRGTAVAGLATIKFNGGRETGRAPHYDPGATVTVTVSPDAAGAAAGISATGGTGTVPDPWDSFDQTFTAPLTTTVPLTVPNGTYTMTVTASGPAHDSHGEALIHETSDTYRVLVDCPNSAPALSWLANPSSADEGQTKTYSFSIADADSTSWSFAAGFPTCGEHGTPAGAASIDSSARTGTFSCSFPDGPASSTVAVAVTDDDGTTSAVLSQAVDVHDAPLTAGQLAIANGVEGVTRSQLTFAFTDANPAATAGDYTATIGWGDGTTSAGTVAAANGGGFTVGAAHMYAEEGAYTVGVTVMDDGGSTTAASGTATVADAPLTATAAVPAVTSSSFSGATASFTDANPAGTAGDFTATIDWGDGTSSPGDVSASGAGFVVRGSHTYAQTGSFTVATSIVDDGGSTASASAQALVYAFAQGGSYVIGDRSTTGTVTFWSPQWAKRNSLSGGSAPSSFKGFAGGSEPACHVDWTAAPGGAEVAAGPLPAYMAVIVSSTITTSGSTIHGDTARIAIVRTGAAAGTGTVVAFVPGC